MQDTVSPVSLFIAGLWPMDFVKVRLCVDFRGFNSMELQIICNMVKSFTSNSSFSFNLIHLILGIHINQELKKCKT